MTSLPTFNQEDEQALTDSLIIHADKLHLITEAYSYAHTIIAAEKALIKLSQDAAINPKRYNSIFYLIKQEIAIRNAFPLSEFSPYVELCLNTLNDEQKYCIKHDSYSEDNKKRILERFKIILKSKEFRKAILGKKNAISDKKQSLLRYINSLFAYRSTLLVLRVDFGYPKFNYFGYPYTKGIYYLAPYTERKIDLFSYPYNKYNYSKRYNEKKISLNLGGIAVREHRDLLIKKLKKKYKKNLVGYVWNIEYGADKGFHCHMIFFLDGSKHQEDISIAQSIGELWKNDITHGKGVYWNCNADKKKYIKNNRIAVGKIHYNDKEKRNNLERMATYVIKPDYFVKTVLPDGARTFGKGGKHKKEKSGRPRKS